MFSFNERHFISFVGGRESAKNPAQVVDQRDVIRGSHGEPPALAHKNKFSFGGAGFHGEPCHGKERRRSASHACATFYHPTSQEKRKWSICKSASSEAYRKMKSGDVRFRMVLTMTGGSTLQ
jgi:hypothetical protein